MPRRLHLVLAASAFISIVLLSLAGAGCIDPDNAGSHDDYEQGVAEVLNYTMTQPLPPGASPVRLTAPPADIQGIYTYGAHTGPEVEGQEYVLIASNSTALACSYADGTVISVKENSLPLSFFWMSATNNTTYDVTVDYGRGLKGVHLWVEQPLVKPGDAVGAGQPVARPLSDGYSWLAFALIDEGRQDGIKADNGSYVSPFDYLRDDVRQAFIDDYKALLFRNYHMARLNPGSQSAEPRLTNPLPLHTAHKGEVIGEWQLTGDNRSGGYPDLIVLLDNRERNKLTCLLGYSNGTVAYRSWQTEQDVLSQLLGTNKGRLTIFDINGEPEFYGLYELDESDDRAMLKIEFGDGSYPAGVSGRAATYTERPPVTLRTGLSFIRPA